MTHAGHPLEFHLGGCRRCKDTTFPCFPRMLSYVYHSARHVFAYCLGRVGERKTKRYVRTKHHPLAGVAAVGLLSFIVVATGVDTRRIRESGWRRTVHLSLIANAYYGLPVARGGRRARKCMPCI